MLTTAVGRVCIDMLRARKVRRESYTGTSLPAPVVSSGDQHDPEQQAVLADSVGMAPLVVLDSLQPVERLAFVLHDMFAVPFDEIATIIDKSPAATRQLTSRARRRVQGRSTVADPDLSTRVASSTPSSPRRAPEISTRSSRSSTPTSCSVWTQAHAPGSHRHC
jgi:hypothetical protein